MQLLLQNDQCALAAPTRNDQKFFFLLRSKRSGLLRTKESDEGVAALLMRVEGRSSTEGRQLMLSFFAWIRGSLLQSAYGRCQYRSSWKQRHNLDSECRQDGRGSGRSTSVGGATRALVLFCIAV